MKNYLLLLGSIARCSRVIFPSYHANMNLAIFW